MTYSRVILVLAALLWGWIAFFGAGCSAFGSDGSDVSVVSASLDAMNNSGETGTATLTALSDGTTQVALTTTGGSDTGVQSAVIREGACGSDGALFAVLNNLQGRQSITTLPYTVGTLTGSMYYVDVHSSTSVNDSGACGVIP